MSDHPTAIKACSRTKKLLFNIMVGLLYSHRSRPLFLDILIWEVLYAGKPQRCPLCLPELPRSRRETSASGVSLQTQESRVAPDTHLTLSPPDPLLVPESSPPPRLSSCHACSARRWQSRCHLPALSDHLGTGRASSSAHPATASWTAKLLTRERYEPADETPRVRPADSTRDHPLSMCTSKLKS